MLRTANTAHDSAEKTGAVMIEIIRECTPEETKEQARYLADTPVQIEVLRPCITVVERLISLLLAKLA